MRSNIKQLLAQEELDIDVEVKGWVRNRRGSTNVAFISMNDGSCVDNIQVVVDFEKLDEETIKDVRTGACLAIKGKMIASKGKQDREVIATEITIYGLADADTYPFQPKKHSLEFVRANAHLRSRTATFSSVFRVRHTLAMAIHKFFDERDFYYVHTPIITASDAEGAGEMFRVTNMDLDKPIRDEEGNIDYKEDFFGKATHLTVSGQLEAELFALGMGAVYTFGPTFRAENSNTTRHLAEFWMVEPEMAFHDLDDNMDVAEAFVKYVIKYALEHNIKDLELLEKRLIDEEKSKKEADRSPMPLIEKLKFVSDNDFARVTYTEAIQILLSSKPHKKGKFKYEVKWGIDLQSEHERFLVEKHFKKPLIVTDYPIGVKAFYMKQNEGEEAGKETVRAMDMLVPGLGEMIGGSQREENYDKLLRRMNEMDIPKDEMWWYLDTRKFGTAPHSGFGLGFERLIQFVTGMLNIRDVIPFPRAPKSADF